MRASRIPCQKPFTWTIMAIEFATNVGDDSPLPFSRLQLSISSITLFCALPTCTGMNRDCVLLIQLGLAIGKVSWRLSSHKPVLHKGALKRPFYSTNKLSKSEGKNTNIPPETIENKAEMDLSYIKFIK